MDINLNYLHLQSDRPNGNYIFGPMMFTTIAFILSNSATRWCDYINRETLAVDPRYPWFGTAGDSTNIGIWSFQGQSAGSTVCFIYPNDMNVDTRYNTARVFSTWTTLMGGLIMITMWFTSCKGISRFGWATMGFLLMVNCLFEGLTLLLKSSSICDPAFASCNLARGSRCGISAIVFWFIAGASVATVPPPKVWHDIFNMIFEVEFDSWFSTHFFWFLRVQSQPFCNKPRQLLKPLIPTEPKPQPPKQRLFKFLLEDFKAVLYEAVDNKQIINKFALLFVYCSRVVL